MTTEEDLEFVKRNFPNDKAYKVELAGNLSLPEFISGSRQNMFSLHLEQHVPLIHPESPKLSTSFEKPYGKYSDSYKTANADYRVIAVIPKFVNISRFNYVYVVQNMLTKVYDLIDVKHYACLSEDRGYLRPYTDGDKYKAGDIIKKGSTIYRADSHDEFGNYRYGVNPKCAYISLPEDEEDGIYARKGFLEKLAFYDIVKTPVTINKNQILINYYGDNANYKIIPDIGEEVKDGILCAKRTINYSNIAAECTNNELKHVLTSDEVYRGGGVVGDIDIWVNDTEEFENAGNRSQLLKYYNICLEYYTKIFNVLDPIVNAPNKDNVQYTHMLRWHYEHARNYLDKNIIWMNNNNSIEFAYIEVLTYEKKIPTTGYKITDRYGSKGVITHVCDDDMMPMDEYGNVADLVLSPPGVPSRANPGQWYENEYLFIAEEVWKRINSLPTIQAKEKLLVEFVCDAMPTEGLSLKNFLATKNMEQKIRFFADLEVNGIDLIKEPFDEQITPENLDFLYKKYKIEPKSVLISREFKDTMTGLPLENNAKAKVDDDGYVVPTFDMDVNKRQLGSSKGVSPFDINKDDEYTEVGKGVAPDFNGGYDTVNLFNYSTKVSDNRKLSPAELLKKAKPGECVKAWINSNGNLVRQYKSIKPVIIGRKYYMLLKQMPDEKFSARSIGSTSQVGIPNKTGKQTKITSPYAKSAIRLCEMDNDVNFCRIDPEIENRFMATHSTNPELCEKLGQMLLTEDPFELHDLPIKNEDIKDNVPALLFHSALYSIGREIDDIYEGDSNDNIDDMQMNN